MPRLTLAALLSVLVLLPGPLGAQAFEGRWEMTRETPRGAMTQTLTLVQGEDGWSGTLALMQREVQLKEVEVSGDRIRFTIELEARGRPGGEGRALSQTFTGTLEGDRIHGEMDGPRGARPVEFTRVKG